MRKALQKLVLNNLDRATLKSDLHCKLQFHNGSLKEIITCTPIKVLE